MGIVTKNRRNKLHFTELLVALIIFSIAILGLAQMQILSLKNTEEALQTALLIVQEPA